MQLVTGDTFYIVRCERLCVSAVHVFFQSLRTDVNTRCEQGVRASHTDVQSLHLGDMWPHKFMTVSIIEAQFSIRKAHMAHASCQLNSLNDSNILGRRRLTLLMIDFQSQQNQVICLAHQLLLELATRSQLSA